MHDMAASDEGVVHGVLAACGAAATAAVAWLAKRAVKRLDDDIMSLKEDGVARTEAIGELSERVARVEVRQADMGEDVRYIRDRLDDQWGAKQPWTGRERRREDR